MANELNRRQSVPPKMPPPEAIAGRAHGPAGNNPNASGQAPKPPVPKPMSGAGFRQTQSKG